MVDDSVVYVPLEILNTSSADQWIPIILAVIGAVWTAFKSSEKYQSWKRTDEYKKYDAAINAIEAGVSTVYENYVRKCKLEAENNKLTDEQRATARIMALSTAEEIAGKDLSVSATLGGQAQALAAVEDAVNRKKLAKK